MKYIQEWKRNGIEHERKGREKVNRDEAGIRARDFEIKT